MSTAPLIDLDAAKRESRYPDGIPVVKGGVTFTLPAELPVEVFDPFLAEDLGLIEILKDVLDGDKDDDKGIGDLVIDALTARPALPRELLGAIKDAFAIVFGDEQYAAFVAQKPSVNDYLRLVRGLQALYGVGLGEASASPASSESAGSTPKPTSDAATDSTPDSPGEPPTTPTS